jgi:SAM-dependent methyltransferase
MKDYSEYLKKPGMLEFIENSWLTEAKEIHDFHAEVINEVIEKYNLYAVIEIGCGTGNIAKRLITDKIYLGFDLNEDCIKLAIEKTGNKTRIFINRDIREFNKGDIKMLNGKKSLVFTFGFLKHFGIHEWNEIFAKVCSIGDYLIFNMPIAERTHDDGIEFHHVWANAIELKTQIEKNGFIVLKVIEHGVEPIFICKRSETII